MIKRHPISAQAPEDLRVGLRKMLNEHGEARTRHLLHLSRTTIERVLASENVRRATVTHLRHGLAMFGLVKAEVVEVKSVPPAEPPRPVAAFVRERCVVARGQYVESSLLHTAWTHWCRKKGLQASSPPIFGRDLMALNLGVKVVRPRDGAIRVRTYEGIRLTA